MYQKYKRINLLYLIMLERNHKCPRSKLSQSQKEYLTTYFEMNPRPTTQERAQISIHLGVPESKIKNWFQNRRAKERYASEEANLHNRFQNHEEKIYPRCNSLFTRRDGMI
ncbi:Homeobox protein HD-9 [Nosema granulosis]|uniref:Homeobox protein HD-9 n=1 Tax=Nosema granulosis TaxID=83296 RepID=A0A9P6H1J0_9MICR|nr:Homeobox protein HD-9 [Nosema granulosis]